MILPAYDLGPTTDLLKALSDENRLRMLSLLKQGELCVCHIAGALALTQPNVSQHLTVLKNLGVVGRERRGSWIYYRILVQSDPARSRILDAVLDGLPGAEDQQKLEEVRNTMQCS